MKRSVTVYGTNYTGAHFRITPDLARRRHEEAYQKVHAATQVLTNDLTAIGFPLYERPDYDAVMEKFFEAFDRIAMEALAEL